MGPESLRGGSRARTGFRTQALEPACLLECRQRLMIWACVWKASPGGIDSSFPFLISLLVLCTLICFLGVPLQALIFSPFLQCLRSFGPLALYSLTPPSTSPSSLPPLDWSRQLSYLPGKKQKTQLRAMGPSPRKLLGMVTRQVGGGGWLEHRAGWEVGGERPTRNLSLVLQSGMGFRKWVGEEREVVCDWVLVCFPPHSQKRPRGRQRKMSQEPGRRHSKLTLTASHMVKDWESCGHGRRESLRGRSSGTHLLLSFQAPRLWVWTSLCRAWSMCMGSLSMQTT